MSVPTTQPAPSPAPEQSLIERQRAATALHMARTVRSMVEAGTMSLERARRLFPGFEAELEAAR